MSGQLWLRRSILDHILLILGGLLIRTKSLLDRVGRRGSRWQTLLPVISVLIVTLFLKYYLFV